MRHKLLRSTMGIILVMIFVIGCSAGAPESPKATPTPVPPVTAPATKMILTPSPDLTADPSINSGINTHSYWPTKAWQYSTPEKQGVDSDMLAQMFEQIQAQQIPIESVIVIRHGYIVTEAYYYPAQAKAQIAVWSITKSVVSALTGIAIHEGAIDSVDHKVLDYFPEFTVKNNDARKQAITIEHLLSMSSGLQWSDDIDMGNMQRSGGIQYVMDRPMAADPGTTFAYNTGAPDLLTAILQKTTGQDALTYAQKRLFEPLGITDISWEKNVNDYYRGGYGLTMLPQDMAKLGYLYLHNGMWDGKQIIPADWVKTSLSKHIDPHMENEDRSGYGYLWWLQTFGASAAHGAGGQYILVMPAQELVVVFTSHLPNQDFHIPGDLFKTYIVPAIKSPDALPANPEAADRLDALVKTAAQRP